MNAPPQGPVDRAPARVGQVLRGKWRLDELLAVGGMASVFAATHRNGKRGAVKLLHYELSLNEESRTRFLREGYVANKVDHEGAVSVLDDDVCEDGTVFLVMELLEGQTLDTVLRARNTRTFGLGETLRVADRLLDVLAAAHGKGVVHRDIKPENLFITTQGTLKVLDFGIARLREAAAGAGVTRAGDLLGTPSFMSPEQALGNMDAVDGRSDLWSVGATIFRLLTGRPVHDAETVNRVLLAAMTMPAPPIARVLPAVPPDLALIVDRALAFDPGARWPDARSMRAALRAFAERSGIRMEGAVLNGNDESKARPATLPLDAAAARPLPAAGQPAYPSPAAGAPMGTPPPGSAPPVYTSPSASVPMGTPPPGSAPPVYTSPPASVPTGTPPPGSAPQPYNEDATRVHTPSQQRLAGDSPSQPSSPSSPASASGASSSGSAERRRVPAAPVPFARSLAPPIFAEQPQPPAQPRYWEQFQSSRQLPPVTPPPPNPRGGTIPVLPAVTPPPLVTGAPLPAAAPAGGSAMSELGLLPDADEDDDDAKTRLREEGSAAAILRSLPALASAMAPAQSPPAAAPAQSPPAAAPAALSLGSTTPLVPALVLPPAPAPAPTAAAGTADPASSPAAPAVSSGPFMEPPPVPAAAVAASLASASTTGERPAAPVPFASTTGEHPAAPAPFASTTGERPIASPPGASPPSGASQPVLTFATPTGERPLTSAPAFAPSFHTGTPVSRDTIPVDLGTPPSASKTPSFSTASPVARDVDQLLAREPPPDPRRSSRKLVALVVIGAVVVLGGLAVFFFAGGASDDGAASTGAPAADTSGAAPATSSTFQPTSGSTSSSASTAGASSSSDTPASAASSGDPAAPTASATASASASATATAATSTAPSKPPPTVRRPPPGPSKGDPFSSRKW